MPAELPFAKSLSPDILLQIDELCDQFESELQAGRKPALESVLPGVVEAARPQLFHDLLELEVRYRQQAGQPLTAEEAGPRFAALGNWVSDGLALFGLNASDSRFPDVRAMQAALRAVPG